MTESHSEGNVPLVKRVETGTHGTSALPAIGIAAEEARFHNGLEINRIIRRNLGKGAVIGIAGWAD